MSELRRFYYDIAQAFQPIPLAALKKLVPSAQILFGTDYPYRTSPETVQGLSKARSSLPPSCRRSARTIAASCCRAPSSSPYFS